MPEPRDPQVSDRSPQAETGRGWLVPTLALLSLSTGHFPYDPSHFGANLRVSLLPTSRGSWGRRPARFGVLGCVPRLPTLRLCHPAG